ncbi:MAG: tRNA1(Val) (adenine(37)-N6)-methyltransferase [Deltaproteobacteria bacterium]|nr:tRNA1(Val) (adenine(37)-N6)-methyltransferase [Deltaproteobacteria bacterium]
MDTSPQALQKEGESLDELLDGGLKILQKTSGYRFSIDALLLAHFCRLRQGERVLDLGTGSAVIPLLLARRWEGVQLIGIDVQEKFVDMARRSIDLNGLSERIEIRLGDVRHIEAHFEARSFDAVVFNPPYRRSGSGRINRDDQKALARHEIKGTLADFLAAAAYVLKEGCRCYVIYPASRAVELLFRMRRDRLEPKRLRMVHSRAGSEGQFVLAEGIREGGEELAVLAPLFIYEEGGGYTAEMEGLFKDLSASLRTASG